MKWCSFRRNAFALAMPPHPRPFSPRGTGGEGGIEKREGVLAVSHRTAGTSPMALSLSGSLCSFLVTVIGVDVFA